MSTQQTFISGWYAICRSSEVTSHKPLALQRFGLELVLWRSADGQPQCMLDRCPHRGAKLSLGKVKSNCLICPYHGFQFNAAGACDFAPEFQKAIPGIAVKKFAVMEAMDMIWVFYGKTPSEFKFPELESIHQRFSKGFCDAQRIWDSHITYCIENQLDYTHLPNVHHNTIGRGFNYPTDPTFDLDARRIAVYFNNKRLALEFFFPNIWILNISEKMQLAVYFAPIDECHTQLYLRSYNAWLKFSPTRPLLSLIFKWVNSIILKQDERVVCSQGLAPSYVATHDVLMKNDKAVKYFRESWRSRIDEATHD